MRITPVSVASSLLLGVFLAGAAARPGLAQGASLADLAKKEEERRKTAPAAAKVYTNKDLGSVPAPSSAQPDASAKPGDADKAGDKAKNAKDAKDAKEAPKEPAKDQAYWSERMKALQGKLDQDMNFQDAMQTRINALATDFVNRDDPAQKALIERDRQRALAELERLKIQIVADRKAVADFQEEARRAGVPPGWLR